MTSKNDSSHRRVEVERTALGEYRATNERGGSITLHANPEDFTSVELLLTAIGACTLADVDYITTKRAEPESLSVEVRGDKVKDDDEGNIMRNLSVTFHARYPEGEDGDAAREVLPKAVTRSHDRLCTVGRTVQTASPIESVVSEASA
ncbi:MAG TPA: OsmC family protein [Acidimicrobiia bacterium]|nr:OsmC family protein [Acidimicrobiia bacterium]